MITTLIWADYKCLETYKANETKVLDLIIIIDDNSDPIMPVKHLNK